MLPKKFRLTVAQFNFLPQKSTTYASDYLIMKIKEEKENQYPKVAIIVPKFLDKRSAKRHIAKRVIEEAIRSMIKNIKISANILVRVKKNLKKENSQMVVNEIRILLAKANILCP